MRRLLLTTAILIFSALHVSHADEGMWMLQYLNRMNVKDMRSKGFRLSEEDIYNLNGNAIKDAIVIFGGGCTGEVVSAEGLLLTNHHCGYGAIQQHSSVENDYLKNGFWAMNRREEIPTPGLSVTFIRSFEDVSEKILPFVEGLSEEERAAKIIKLCVGIEKEAIEEGSTRKAQVKSFFGGNQHILVISESYSDVRLVGAPPSSIGKFGGDTDNWMWPRQTGDFSVFRIYADVDGKPSEYSRDNVPYKAPKHLPISLKGYKEGDFAMVIGFPGATERYMTSYEIDYMLDVDNPVRIYVRGERQELMMEDMLASDKVRIQYATKYFGSSNYWKNSIGMSRGLRRLGVKAQKENTENEFRRWIAENPARQEKYGNAMTLIKDAVESRASDMEALQYMSEALLRGNELIEAAMIGASVAGEDKKIDSVLLEKSFERMAGFYKNYSPSMDRKIAKRMFAIVRDGVSADKRPVTFDFIDGGFNGDINAYIDYIYDNSLFASEERYNAFVENFDYDAILNDPAYKLRRSIVEAYNALIPSVLEYDNMYNEGHRLYVAGLMEMWQGKALYPDANFTMRLTYGQVLPYDPQDGVTYHYYTTLKGVMDKEDPENEYEFSVPDKLKQLYAAGDFGPYGVKGEMPVCFISNNDITGGNSGSPVMNGRGELLGLAFDGNWEAMSGDVAFEPELQRCINVNIRYVLFIIDKFAGAGWLLNEMTIVK